MGCLAGRQLRHRQGEAGIGRSRGEKRGDYFLFSEGFLKKSGTSSLPQGKENGVRLFLPCPLALTEVSEEHSTTKWRPEPLTQSPTLLYPAIASLLGQGHLRIRKAAPPPPPED